MADHRSMSVDGRSPARVVEVDDRSELRPALGRLGVGGPRPVLISVGGASGLDARTGRRLLDLFRAELMPVLSRLGAAVVDGGTDAGIMAVMGQARRAAGVDLPLIGVAARGTVRLPGEPADRGTALEPGHTHFVLVPGNRWGDEVPWLGAVADLLANGRGAVTMVTGGGRITERDVAASLAANRPTLLLAGSGGTADALVNRRNPQSQIVSVLDLERDGEQLGERLWALLRPDPRVEPAAR
jgi:hypothetical protein